MPACIVKLERDGEARYMEWSTIVDAPVSELMTREDFRHHYMRSHAGGRRSNKEVEAELRERLARADLSGCSALPAGMTAEDCVRWNRAGAREGCLTVDEIWEKYTKSEASDD